MKFAKQLLAKIAITLTVIMSGALGLAWYKMNYRPVDPGLEKDIRAMVTLYPDLQPLLDQATADHVLSLKEAARIIDAYEKQKLRKN